MRILIRTSKWAIWARRFGSLAVPLTVVPVLLHREQLISSTDFAVVESVAAGVAALALILGLSAYARLWVTGDRGWGKATWGLCFAIACLLPFGYLGFQALRYPLVNEVATDFADPLPLSSSLRVVPTGAALQQLIATTFPNARTRTYPIDATQMFATVEDLVEQRGWEVRTRRAPPTALDSGQLNAISVSLFGWRDEVAIRVEGTASGSTVDMRSVPLSGFHDFGENGRRVEEFLLALDARITLLLRDAPAAPAGDADTDPGDPGDAAAAPGPQ
jgi:hypothetical protein